ncbi:MAG: paraquat-inducible protein A [Ferruginibacter sp.]
MVPAKQSQQTATSLLKTVVVAIFGILLITEVWFGYQVQQQAEARRVHKLAYAFVNNVSFGLLSVDIWRDQVVEKVRQEMGNFRMTNEQQQELRTAIDAKLQSLVNQTFAEINRPKKSLGGKLKKVAINTLVHEEEVTKEIPGFSKKIMGVLTSPSSYKRIANIADTTIAQISRKIYDSSVAATTGIMDSIYHSYGSSDKTSFELRNKQESDRLTKNCFQYLVVITSCAALMLFGWIIFRRKKNLRPVLYVFCALGALVLLFSGISLPTMEIDATLATMDIRFLNGSLNFRNQSLFFQSQSIVDVIRLLVGSGGMASIIVGLMIAIFCIGFPIIILLASGMAVINPEKWGQNKYVDYLGFHATKWNMADVLTVAILMTFIGFNGIIDNTLSTLDYAEESITSVTSNKTAIEPGYFFYLAFVVISTVLVAVLKRTRKIEMTEQLAINHSETLHYHE